MQLRIDARREEFVRSRSDMRWTKQLILLHYPGTPVERLADAHDEIDGVYDEENDEEEEEDIYLRFFDQSHQIREFTAFFGMTPREFIEGGQHLLTLSLEIRQARRLETLHRLDPGAIRPWMREPVIVAPQP